MKKYKIVFVLLFISACTGVSENSYEQKLSSWVGRNEYALLETFGRPQKVFAVNQTDYAWVYEKTNLPEHHNLYQNVFSYNGWQGPQYGKQEVSDTYYCQTIFTLREGIIINFAFNGDDCY